MNLKVIYIFFGSIMLFGLIILSLSAQTKSESTSDLKIKIEQLKSNYVLGEVVQLDIEIRNQGELDAKLFGTDVESGYLQVYISQDDKTYKKYSNGTWGNKKQKGKVLKSSEVIKSTATVLSNIVPDTTGLSDAGVIHLNDKQLTTIYAFPKAGDYYLKVVLITPGEDGNLEVASEPVKIKVAEPTDEDLQVWNLIKNRNDFAFFIQNGQQVDFKSVERQTKFQQEVEDIINKFPNNSVTKQISESLEKYKAAEEKRKAYLEKIKNQP